MSLFRNAFRDVVAASTIAAAAGPMIAARYPASPAPAPAEMSMRFSAKFDGVGAEGIDDIWTGDLAGAKGEVTIRLEHLGSEMDRANAVWPVHALVFVAADDASKSMITDANGTLDWRTGEMTLKGTVTGGYQKGSAIEERVKLDSRTLEGSGSLQVESELAAR
jgi:hypothetical protein